MNRSRLISLLLLILLGLVVRIIAVFTIPFNFDEVHNILITRNPDLLTVIRAAGVHPPLHFLILSLWQLLFINPYAVRILPLVFGIASIPMLAYLTNKQWGWKTGFTAALLLTISPMHIYYSAIARMYALAIFEAIFIVYYFSLYNKKNTHLPHLSLWLLLGLYTHYFFIILWVILSASVYISHIPSGRSVLSWTKAQIVIAILSLPLALILARAPLSLAVPATTLSKLPIFWLTPLLPWDVLEVLTLLRFGKLDFLSIQALILGLGTILLLFLAILAARKNTIRILSAVYLTAPGIIFVISYLITPIAGVRSFIIFSPLWLAVVVPFLTSLSRLVYTCIMFTLVSLSLLFSMTYVLNYTGRRDDLNQIYSRLSDADTVVYNDIVLFLPSILLKPKGNHYLFYPGYLDPLSLQALQVKLSNFTQVPKSERLWYVRQATNWPAYERQADELQHNLQTDFSEVGRSRYYQFQLVEYLPKQHEK